MGSTYNVFIYINDTLQESIETSEAAYLLNNLQEGVVNNVKVIVDDGNLVFEPAEISFTTLSGDIYEGDLEFYDQESLDQFGVNNFTSVIGTLNFGLSCACEFPINDFNALNSIIDITGNVYFKLLTGLIYPAPLSGLENVKTIDGDLEIIGFNLGNVFNNLEVINGNVFFNRIIQYDNDPPVLEKLQTINGKLRFYESAVESNINGFYSLNNISNLEIHETRFQNLDFLSSLSLVESEISIWWNFSLTDYCGLEPLIMTGAYGNFNASDNNAYNPSERNMIEGNCSL